jgi:YesN/AraC family two-component response regulator
MKPLLFKIPIPIGQSFSLRTDISKNFRSEWHYHPEIEIIYFREGSGTALIGNSITLFKKDDFFILGPNLPHMFKSDKQDDEDESISEAIIIHFSIEILQHFLSLPENNLISKLLSNSVFGLNVSGENKMIAIEIINNIGFTQKTKRLISLLELLNTVAESKENIKITNSPLKIFSHKDDDKRLNRIYQYTLNNFHHQITLKEIANVIYMTPNAFCRYFKSRTKKQYSQFLIELRISHACKLLLETDFSIGIISFESGFMNLSNFNRYFKSVTGKSPLNYKKNFIVSHN